MTFGEKLRNRRKELSLTQDDVAGFFENNLSRQTISKWENDAAMPELDNLLTLAANLDFSIDEMFAEIIAYKKRIAMRSDKKSTDALLPDCLKGASVGLTILSEALKKI